MQDVLAKKKKLTEVLPDLEDAVSETSLYLESLDKSDLPLTLRAFGQLQGAKNRLEASYEMIKKMYDNLSYEVIPDLFEANGCASFKSDDGKNFVMNVRLDASIPREKRDAGFEWVRNVAKAPELIQEQVNPRSLSSVVKQMLEENGTLPPDDAVTVSQKRYMSIRKA